MSGVRTASGAVGRPVMASAILPRKGIVLRGDLRGGLAATPRASVGWLLVDDQEDQGGRA